MRFKQNLQVKFQTYSLILTPAPNQYYYKLISMLFNIYFICSKYNTSCPTTLYMGKIHGFNEAEAILANMIGTISLFHKHSVTWEII